MLNELYRNLSFKNMSFKLVVKLILSFRYILIYTLYNKYLRVGGAKLNGYCLVRNCILNGKVHFLEIGYGSVIENSELALHNKIKIGSYSVINSGCKLLTASHKTDDVKWTSFSEEIIIGDYCWLATNVLVLPGVKIANGTIVAAGSIVTKCFPENSIIAGNPAIFIKKRSPTQFNYTPLDSVGFIQPWRS